MKKYLDLLADVMLHGMDSEDRTGTGTRCMFGKQIRFNLEDGFPAVTTKKFAFNSMKAELLWFISGSCNVHDLRAIQYGEAHRYDTSKRTVWDDNYNNEAAALGYKEGHLGAIYGVQWRRSLGVDGITPVAKDSPPRIEYEHSVVAIDQLKQAIETIKSNSDSRRIIVDSWNPHQIKGMALPPCHMMYQFRVMNGKLSCLVYIRSNDLFLGAPYNIASYALLTHMVAQVCGLGDLIYTIGDAHIYKNHFDQVAEQLLREPHPLPILSLNPTIKDIDKFTMDDINLGGYIHHPAITAPMAFKKNDGE
jgi:thymidylate synthase